MKPQSVSRDTSVLHMAPRPKNMFDITSISYEQYVDRYEPYESNESNEPYERYELWDDSSVDVT